MPIMDTMIEPEGPNMAPFYSPETASSPISFNPLAFRIEPETLAGLGTYNRVEDKD